ncbi:MAG: cytochrome B [Chlorobi bacterium]|nr:cytochrome B [Chlorobiota bacterium]
MGHKLYLYPKWLRIWHFINLMLFFILIATGLSMHYSAASGWLVSSTGKAVSNVENGNFLMDFMTAVKWHNIAAIILCFNYLFYLIANSYTGNVRYYNIKEQALLKKIFIQARYYAYGMFKGEPHPFPVNEERKFNPLQKTTYFITMYVLMPLLVLSGIGLFFPELIPDKIFGLSGLLVNSLIHITVGYFLSLFMIVHIYICTLGVTPSTLFKGMINGYHEVH